jgi:hypothetical protein
VRLFIGRRFSHRLPEGFDGRFVFLALLMYGGQFQEQRVVRASQFLSPLLCPLLVAVLWQELTGVKVDGRPVCCGLPAMTSGSGGALEGIDVYPEQPVRAQGEQVSPERQATGSVV